MKKYKFSACWFAVADMDKYICDNINIHNETSVLEIGSYEGRSSIWFLENIIKYNSKSLLTCVDSWLDYSQNYKSFYSYSNMNTEWKLESNKIKDTFLYNIKESGFESSVIIGQGKSQEILPRLIIQNNKYDIIFIDGNHTSPFVLSDAVMSWFLLKEDGLMIFDDYEWINPKADFNSNKREKLEPKLAINSFISVFEDYIEIIYSGYRKVIKKKKPA